MGIKEVFGFKPKLGIAEAGIGLVSRSNVGFNSLLTGVDSEPQNYSLQKQYENAYMNYPIVASAIDITAEQVVQDFYFDGPNSKKLEEWRDEVNLDQKFLTIAKSLLKNGNLWVEVPDVNEMKFIDPRTITTHRELTGEIIGHSQDIDGTAKVLWGSTGKPELDAKYSQKAPLKEIIHFKFNVLPGEKYGASIIHPCLPLLALKSQVEFDLKNIVRRYAAPIIHAQVGDEAHLPSATDLDSIRSKLVDIYSDTEYVTNYLTKFNVLGFEGKAMNVDYILKHIDENIIAGLQVPGEFLGLTSSNKAEAEVKLRSFNRHVAAIQRALKSEFEDNIIIGLGLGSKEDKLVWEAAEERERIIQMDMIRGLVKDGLITPQKGNDLLPPEFREKLPVLQAIPGSTMNTPDKAGNLGGNSTDPTQRKNSEGRAINRSDVQVPVGNSTEDKSGRKRGEKI